MNREYRDILAGVVVFVIVAWLLGGFKTGLELSTIVIASIVAIVCAFILDKLMGRSK